MSNTAKTLPTGSKVTAPDGDGIDSNAIITTAGYKVRWNDGSGVHWVPAAKVKFEGEAPPVTAVPADHPAEAEWENGDYYGVTVQAGGYQLDWEESGGKAWVLAGRVRPRGGPPVELKGEFEVGAHVQALWPNGHFYGATVKEFDGEKYLVAWDDGSTPTWRAREHIQKD